MKISCLDWFETVSFFEKGGKDAAKQHPNTLDGCVQKNEGRTEAFESNGAIRTYLESSDYVPQQCPILKALSMCRLLAFVKDNGM